MRSKRTIKVPQIFDNSVTTNNRKMSKQKIGTKKSQVIGDVMNEVGDCRMSDNGSNSEKVGRDDSLNKRGNVESEGSGMKSQRGSGVKYDQSVNAKQQRNETVTTVI
ncbi:hypothetical protein Tco_0445612 [Tanacetum coccineum]